MNKFTRTQNKKIKHQREGKAIPHHDERFFLKKKKKTL